MVTDLQQKVSAARWTTCVVQQVHAKGKRLPMNFYQKKALFYCVCVHTYLYMVCNIKCLGTHNPVLT